MVIAIYGQRIEPQHQQNIQLLFKTIENSGAKVMLYEPFYNFLSDKLSINVQVNNFFSKPIEIRDVADMMLSIGGDGTFLESVAYVEDTCIPVAGLNLGRLGFLAHISSDKIEEAIAKIISNEYTVEERSVIKLESISSPFSSYPYALNDITLQKKGTSMVTVNAFINGEFLSTYWADGLIVATPTGSTAYSLSVGGPIISPASNVFCISPIAPHHLTVRPLIIPDSSELILEATSRGDKILVSCDSREETLSLPLKVKITKANFCVGVVNINGNTYYRTLRNKLMWGVDQRNLLPL